MLAKTLHIIQSMISIETLRKNATKFANNFADANYEMGQAQSFIIEFCKIFNLDYLRAVRFEDKVKKAKGKGRIDAFFPSLLLVVSVSIEAYTPPSYEK